MRLISDLSNPFTTGEWNETKAKNFDDSKVKLPDTTFQGFP